MNFSFLFCTSEHRFDSQLRYSDIFYFMFSTFVQTKVRPKKSGTDEGQRQKPKFSSIWVEKRLRNGSETARETAEFRPRSRPALLLEVINDRGELHCHRTRHRGGRALPMSGCPEGRFTSRVDFEIRAPQNSQIAANAVLIFFKKY